jgi:hypothetical protein
MRTLSRGQHLGTFPCDQSFPGGYAGMGYGDGHRISLLCADRIVVCAGYVVGSQSSLLSTAANSATVAERSSASGVNYTSPAPHPPDAPAGFGFV